MAEPVCLKVAIIFRQKKKPRAGIMGWGGRDGK